MVSFRTNAARRASASPARPDAVVPPAPSRWVTPVDDAAIRRDFETLAARIRTLQVRAAREAAALRAGR